MSSSTVPKSTTPGPDDDEGQSTLRNMIRKVSSDVLIPILAEELSDAQMTKLNKARTDRKAKPLSAYFLFSQEERLKVKAEFPEYSITEMAKELGRRWATLDPAVKQSYDERYQVSRRRYEQAMQGYKPKNAMRDPNAPKQPLSAYFIFSSEERLKVKSDHPSYSICEVAKELGRRWADMDPEVKQRYQQMAEEGRQKYDEEMAAYRQRQEPQL